MPALPIAQNTNEAWKICENAYEREIKDDHLTDPERLQVVGTFEKYFLPMPGYPEDGTLTDKYIFIVYET